MLRLIIVDLSVWDKDPLSLIVENMSYVEGLKEAGIDGLVIRSMLMNWHGLSVSVPIKQSKTALKDNDYARRAIKGLLNNGAVKEDVKEVLRKELKRLDNDKKRRLLKSIDIILHPEEKEAKPKAKKFTEMIKLQVGQLYDYIEPFRKKANKSAHSSQKFIITDTYKLIAELFNLINAGENYDHNNIKQIYFNYLNKV